MNNVHFKQHQSAYFARDSSTRKEIANFKDDIQYRPPYGLDTRKAFQRFCLIHMTYLLLPNPDLYTYTYK